MTPLGLRVVTWLGVTALMALLGVVYFRTGHTESSPTSHPAVPIDLARWTPDRPPQSPDSPTSTVASPPAVYTPRTTAVPARAVSQMVVSNPPFAVPGVAARPPLATNLSRPLPPAVAPPPVSGPWVPRAVSGVLETQIALARLGFSPGSIDGTDGTQTRNALRAYRVSQLGAGRNPPPPSATSPPEPSASSQTNRIAGESDGPMGPAVDGSISGSPAVAVARRSGLREVPLLLTEAPFSTLEVQTNDLARLAPVPDSWLEKSKQSRLDFASALELFAERTLSHPELLRRLNPGVNWTNLQPGQVLKVVNAHVPAPKVRAARLSIRLAEHVLEAYDAQTNLIAHFPCSIARRVEKRPVGQLTVANLALNPNYVFDPAVFPESAEAREIGRKLVIPPGPNNPVGSAWIGLNLPGYGIHGTPKPEDVGRTESHGCFRLANWNAEYLARIVRTGTPVMVEP